MCGKEFVAICTPLGLSSGLSPRCDPLTFAALFLPRVEGFAFDRSITD